MVNSINRLLNKRANTIDNIFYNNCRVQTGFFDYRNSLFRDIKCTFSSLTKSAQGLTAETTGTLYDSTARPLDNFNAKALPNEYKPGLKSCRIFDNPNIIDVMKTGEKETFSDMIYRYLDIGGFFSMLNSRKVHLLRTPPEGRLSIMCSTELERKQSLIMKALCSFMMFYLIMSYLQHKKHIFDRHPSPELPVFEFTNNRTKDFTWHGSLPFQYPKSRCKECRWLELECKKKCYDRLLEQGHKFILQNPMQIPRRELLPSPYPPMN